MNVLEVFEKVKNSEVSAAQFNFKINDNFVIDRIIFSSIVLKEGFPGDISANFLIKGHIKGFPDFEVNSFRMAKIYKEGKSLISFIEFNNLENKSALNELVENKILDIDKNVLFLDGIEIFDEEILNKITNKDTKEVIKLFADLTGELIKNKIDLKVIKHLEKEKENFIKEIPDELKGLVDERGNLIENYTPKKTIKEKPIVEVKIKGLSTIPSVNAVLRDVESGKKLNFIKQIIYNTLKEKEILDKETLKHQKTQIGKNILKLTYSRESVRKHIANTIKKEGENLDKIPVKIGEYILDTKINIVKNNREINKKEKMPSV